MSDLPDLSGAPGVSGSSGAPDASGVRRAGAGSAGSSGDGLPGDGGIALGKRHVRRARDERGASGEHGARDAHDPRHRRGKRSGWAARTGLGRRGLWRGAAGLAVVFALWWAAVHLCTTPGSIGRQFSPEAALASLPALVTQEGLAGQALVSLRRVGIGLALALLIGVPLGLLIGRVRWADHALTPTFQFLRMVSPLSLMPLAVMSLGLGDRPIVFLLGFAALWPVLMSAASGVAQIDRRWLLLGQSLAATRGELLLHVALPAIAGSLLVGVRLAIGVLWIVLVPAEMLGVNAGLGYMILDARDRLAYSELMAVILVIGAIGFALDALARAAHRRWAA